MSLPSARGEVYEPERKLVDLVVAPTLALVLHATFVPSAAHSRMPFPTRYYGIDLPILWNTVRLDNDAFQRLLPKRNGVRAMATELLILALLTVLLEERFECFLGNRRRTRTQPPERIINSMVLDFLGLLT